MVQFAHYIKYSHSMSLIYRQLEIQQVISEGAPLDNAQFNLLAENAWLWRVQYRAYCAHLIAHLSTSTTNTHDEKTRHEIQATLRLAKLLEALHERLNEMPIKTKFSQDSVILENLLNPTSDHTPESDASNFPGSVQQATFQTDTTRLLTGHTRRICLGLLAFPKTFTHDLTWIEQFSTALGPILTLAGFLIYLPRTIVNGFLLPLRLSEKQSIPLVSRLQAHAEIDDRLFNLINDFPSVISGTISVFMLTASTAWLAAYITVAVKLCEVIFSALKSHYDVSKLENMREQYNSMSITSEADTNYLAQLDASIAHIRGTRNINTIMHALLLLCLAAFIPPVMMLHPAIPILAACFAISLVCLRFAGFRNFWINAAPPQDDLQSLSLFSSSETNNQEDPLTTQQTPV